MNWVDLETAINKQDTLTEMLDLLINHLDELTEDQLANALIGYRQMHKLIYADLWDTFLRVHKLDQYHESVD